MRVTILIFFSFYYLNCWGQQENRFLLKDSTQYNLATDFLEKEFGKQFLTDTLIFKGVYNSVLTMYTFEIQPLLSPNKNKNMIIIFIDGNKIEKTYNTKINRKDINNYFTGKPCNNIFLNEDYAISMAKKHNLEKGIKDWTIRLSGVADSIYWIVESYDKEEFDPIYFSEGKCFEMDIRSGKFRFLNWSAIE